MKKGRICEKIFLVVFLSILGLQWIPIYGTNDSFTVVVGNRASADGSVLVAHNEDQEGKDYIVNVHKIQAKTYKTPRKLMLENQPVLPEINKTPGFLWLEIPETEFGDTYINENGVLITSNACDSREDKPALTGQGIGFMLRWVLVERATSARHAVEMAGQTIQQIGYYASGRSYIFADANEAWILHVVRGKHWAAARVPSNQVAVVSNRYTIERIDLSDKQNFMASPDIILYAVKRGWYNPKRDGEFNFARVYSDADTFKSPHSVLRQWRGISLLSKKKLSPDSPLPFAFVPRDDELSVPVLFSLLRDHYEGTEYDIYGIDEKSPHPYKYTAICNKSTRYSFVAQLRPGPVRELAYLVWIAFSRPDSNAYSPWYVSITTPPEGYTSSSSDTALKKHFKPQSPSLSVSGNQFSYSYYARLSKIVDQDYPKYSKTTRKEWENYENYVLKMQNKIEKEFRYMYEKNPYITLKHITNYVFKMEYRKWFLASELIDTLGKK